MQSVEPHDLFMSQLKSVVVSTDQLLAEMHNLSCLPGMSCTGSFLSFHGHRFLSTWLHMASFQPRRIQDRAVCTCETHFSI